mgnify:CR=1 FL=1
MVKPSTNKLADLLLTKIFGFYFIIAASITCVQLVLEFNNARDLTLARVTSLTNTIEQTLSSALWEVDDEMLSKALSTIAKKDFISGVILFEDGKHRETVGEDLPKEATEAYIKDGDEYLYQNKYRYDFLINYIDDDETLQIGNATIFFSSSIIFNQVKFTFFITIFNALIKAVCLWLISWYIVNQLVTKRLLRVANAINEFDLNNAPVDINDSSSSSTNPEDEITVLVNEFSKMQATIQSQGLQLKDTNKSLEKLVQVRTVDLEKAIVQLEIEKKSAEDAYRAKGTFLATMSHELRTPMNGIIGAASFLKDELELDEDQKTFFRIIENSADDLLQLINDILDFSKIEAGKIKLDPTPISLDEIISNSIEMVSPEFKKKSLDVSYRIAPGVPSRVLVDILRLKQILLNLMGNAVKFTQKGSIKLFVDAKEHGSNDLKVNFSITDTGIGIPADKHSLIFDSFNQADNSTTREFGGTGLGLAICSRLVDLMGGEMKLESEVGKGSTFHFSIIIKVATDEDL